MKLKFFIPVLITLFLISPYLLAEHRKTSAKGEGDSDTEACYRAHGELRRAMEKVCKETEGVDYDSLDLEDCEVRLKGKKYKALYQAEFKCKE